MKSEPASSTIRKWSDHRVFYPLLIVLCITIVYIQTLTYDFVSYDDYDLVVHNEEYLSNPVNIINSFSTHAFAGKRAESVYYRPILQASYIVDYVLWKLNPAGYHGTTLLLHIMATLALFYLFKKFLHNDVFAFFGSIIFSLHPVQTEAVAWVAGRNDVLLGLFIILMMLSYVHYRELPETRKKYYFVSLIFFTFALFTKEPAAFYLLLFPAYDVCMNSGLKDTLYSRKYALNMLTYVIILLAYLLLRLSIFGNVIGAEQLYGNTPLLDRFLQLPSIVIRHVSLLIVPVQLSIIHPLNSSVWNSTPWNVISLLTLLCCMITISILWKYDKVFSFGMFWVAVGLLPVLNIIPVAVPILEHRLYLPLAGFALILSRVALLLHIRKQSLILYAAMALLIFLTSALSFNRLPVWKNSETLWMDAIEKAPEISRSYFNLSGYYFEQQRYDKVIPLMEQYVRLEPNNIMGYTQLRKTYMMSGNYEQTIAISMAMIQKSPKNFSLYIETGMLLERLNQLEQAIAIYQAGISADTGSYQLHYRLALVNEKTGYSDSAAVHYDRALSLNHSYAPMVYLAGRFYANYGNTKKAIALLQQGMSLASPSREAKELLHSLYRKENREQEYYEFLKNLNIQR